MRKVGLAVGLDAPGVLNRLGIGRCLFGRRLRPEVGQVLFAGPLSRVAMRGWGLRSLFPLLKLGRPFDPRLGWGSR